MLRYYLDEEKTFGNPKGRMTYVTLELERRVEGEQTKWKRVRSNSCENLRYSTKKNIGNPGSDGASWIVNELVNCL